MTIVPLESADTGNFSMFSAQIVTGCRTQGYGHRKHAGSLLKCTEPIVGLLIIVLISYNARHNPGNDEGLAHEGYAQ